MTAEAWAAVASILAVFGGGLLRLHYVLMRIEKTSWKSEEMEKDQGIQWSHIDKHCEEIEQLGNRVTRIEARHK